MATTQIAIITCKLNAAEPTIVPGPSSPASKLRETVSIKDKRISGAELPKAIRVRFATVSFQTFISTSSYVKITLLIQTVFVLEVITLIASINLSAAIEIPKNIYIMPKLSKDYK